MKYAHGFVVLCFIVVMQSFIMNSHEVFIHIHQGCFAGTGTIVRLPQCQWSKPDGYGKISQCITTTKHSKTKTVCIFLGIYCTQRGHQLQYCTISESRWLSHKACLSLIHLFLVKHWRQITTLINRPYKFLSRHVSWMIYLTRRGRVTHRCISKLGPRWFR